MHCILIRESAMPIRSTVPIVIQLCMTHGPIKHCSRTHSWKQHVSLVPWNVSRKVKHQIHFPSLCCRYGTEVGILFYSKNSIWLVKDRRIFTAPPNRNAADQSQRNNSTTTLCVHISRTQHVTVLEERPDVTHSSNKCTTVTAIPAAVQFDTCCTELWSSTVNPVLITISGKQLTQNEESTFS
jgi:hypothetical protein